MTQIKPKLLIVDDQLGIRMLLHEIFEKEGYQIFQAANGVNALQIVKQEAPDLVILDMKLPEMDGLDILKQIKQDNPEIHVIIMTAYGELSVIQEAINHGALTYFAKPFNIDEVIAVVKQELPAEI